MADGPRVDETFHAPLKDLSASVTKTLVPPRWNQPAAVQVPGAVHETPSRTTKSATCEGLGMV